MNDLVRFATSVELATGKKRGRHPVFSSSQFYPYAAERRLQNALRNELEDYIGAAYGAAIFNESFKNDSLEELTLLTEGLSDDFKAEISYAAESIARKVSSSIAEMTEMTVGKPYYPQVAKKSLLKDWESNFQVLCVSAESDAKKDIARLVTQAKNEGWNGKQLKKAVMKELPDKYANRASLIARTESAKLNTSVTLETYKEIGCKYYMWMATLDERVRPEHAVMNGLICSATDPTVWYEENPDDPMHPIEHKRDDTMVHLHPGDDFQCRCTMVMWDPVIDGKYEVKERPEEEETEETEKVSNKEQLEETERQLRLMKAANKRHMERTPEQAEEIRQRWSERERRIRIRQAAEKRHAERNAEAIIKEFNRRIEIRNIAKETVNKASGINGIGIEKLEQTMNGGSKESYSEMKKQSKEINKKIEELKALKYVQDPVQVAKEFDYQTAITVENSIKQKLEKWGFDKLPVDKQKHKIEFEIKWVNDNKKYESWKVASEAYKKILSGIELKNDWQNLKPQIDYLNQMSEMHSKSNKLKSCVKELQEISKNQSAENLVKAKEIIGKSNNYVEKNIDKGKIPTSKAKEMIREFNRVSDERADEFLRPVSQKIWSTLSNEEKLVLTKYTQTYSYLNERLRKIRYVGDRPLDEYVRDLPLLTSAIEKSTISENIVVRRGTDDFITSAGKDLSSLKAGDQFIDGAFLSTSAHKDHGFFKAYNLEIAVPKGSKGIYAEPFSHFNDKGKYNFDKNKLWNGKNKETLGSEREIILQRGSRLEVVEVLGRTIRCKLIGQLNDQP